MFYTWACPRRPIGTALALDRDENSYLGTDNTPMMSLNNVAEIQCLWYVVDTGSPCVLKAISQVQNSTQREKER
jgi:hypothetical protein